MQVDRLKVGDVCAGDAILTRYLLGDAVSFDVSVQIKKGLKILVKKSCTPVPTPGCLLEGWNDDDGACVFKWKGVSVS